MAARHQNGLWIAEHNVGLEAHLSQYEAGEGARVEQELAAEDLGEISLNSAVDVSSPHKVR